MSCDIAEAFKIGETDDESMADSGVIIVSCINSDGGERIEKDRVYKNLWEGEYIYSCPVIEGFDLVGPDTRRILLSKEDKQKVIILTYTKIRVYGRLTIKYLDVETGKYLLPEENHCYLDLGDYNYEAKEIEGYEVCGNKLGEIVLTEEKPHQIIIFEYRSVE